MRAALAASAAFALTTSACAGSPGGDPRVPEYRAEGQTKAHSAKSALRPLVVDWPAADRAALEAQRRKGLVVVRYGGGEMDILPGCRAKPGYRFERMTPKEEGLAIHDGEELRASLPIHSALLSGRIAKKEHLDVKMTVIGVYDSEPRSYRASDLSGDCADATHVVTALTVGAFEILAGASSSAEASASAFGASAGGGRDASREVLNRDGQREACAGGAADRAPDGCGALLRVDLAPIERPIQRGDCAPDDAACMTARAQGGCASGFVRKGDVCVAVDPGRPSLVEGLGGGSRATPRR